MIFFYTVKEVLLCLLFLALLPARERNEKSQGGDERPLCRQRCCKVARPWSPACSLAPALCVPRAEARSPSPVPAVGTLTSVWSQPARDARLRHVCLSPSSSGKRVQLGVRSCLQVELFLNNHSDRNPSSKNGLAPK